MEKQPLGTEYHPRWSQGPPILASVLMMKAWGKAHYIPPCMALLCFTECWQKVSTYVFVIWFLILARTVFHSTEEHCVVAIVIMKTTHGKGSTKWGSFFGIVFPIEKIWNDLVLAMCLFDNPVQFIISRRSTKMESGLLSPISLLWHIWIDWTKWGLIR
jgi:hypothetical protein